MKYFIFSIPSWALAVTISTGVAGALFLFGGWSPKNIAAVAISLFLILIYPKQMMLIAVGLLTIRFWPISIPFVAIGALILYWLKRKRDKTAAEEDEDIEVEYTTTDQEEIKIREK